MISCGFCSTPSKYDEQGNGIHNCVHELPWFDKLWICSCECNSEWKPVAVVVEKDGSLGPVPEGIKLEPYVRMTKRQKKAKAEQSSSEEEETAE